MGKTITILGIESSCDETAAAIVEDGRHVLSNEISSQIEIHTLYGGVVPEIASRKHVERINQVIRKTLDTAGKRLKDVDAVAVTYGPGLVGALLVGVCAAKGICLSLDLPLVGVNHIEGHICANYVADPALKPPFICLVVSGGHTHLVYVSDYGKYQILGQSVDDAAGEAFDKVARAIGLGYPGGPKIDKASEHGDPDAIHFPRGKVTGSRYDFSFSGLKSAVLNYIHSEKQAGREIPVNDVAASFQACCVEMLLSHAFDAVEEYHCDTFALAGGVAANRALRNEAMKRCREKQIHFVCPPPILCTDNAAMIACAGYYDYQNGVRSGYDLNAVPNLRLGER